METLIWWSGTEEKLHTGNNKNANKIGVRDTRVEKVKFWEFNFLRVKQSREKWNLNPLNLFMKKNFKTWFFRSPRTKSPQLSGALKPQETSGASYLFPSKAIAHGEYILVWHKRILKLYSREKIPITDKKTLGVKRNPMIRVMEGVVDLKC